jgi:hemolysin activation/secretion protein
MLSRVLINIAIAGASLLLGLPATPASAQHLRPGDERPALPEFGVEEAPQPHLRLPPIQRMDPKRLSSGLRVVVREFRVVGSTVFSEDELARITAPYRNREINSEELIELRDAITECYLTRGYLTSGAFIPAQRVTDGTVQIHVIEGRLTSVSVEGTRYFRPSYLRRRVESGTDRPLNIHELQGRLQILQQDARISRLEAQLGPGELRGESQLRVRVAEESPYGLSFSVANDESPSIGSERGQIRAEHRNLTGNGDILGASFNMVEGLDQWDARYSVPVNARDTILGLHFEQSRSEVVERPFDDLDIEAESITYGVSLRHPLYRKLGTEFWVAMIGELRRSETFLLGEPFSFSSGMEEGESKVTVLRLSQEWTSQSQTQVVAARSTLSFGLDLFDASDAKRSGTGLRTPDGTFFSWLGQFQWARRFSRRYLRSQLVFRADVQLTPGPLLSLEQFSVGGFRTVRGYRENRLVRDNGVVTSLELRIPVLRSALGQDILQIAPFGDFGHAWNDHGEDRLKTITSLGLGLRYQMSPRLFASLYWAGRLRDIDPRGDDLQDKGWSFQLTYRAF